MKDMPSLFLSSSKSNPTMHLYQCKMPPRVGRGGSMKTTKALASGVSTREGRTKQLCCSLCTNGNGSTHLYKGEAPCASMWGGVGSPIHTATCILYQPKSVPCQPLISTLQMFIKLQSRAYRCNVLLAFLPEERASKQFEILYLSNHALRNRTAGQREVTLEGSH